MITISAKLELIISAGLILNHIKKQYNFKGRTSENIYKRTFFLALDFILT